MVANDNTEYMLFLLVDPPINKSSAASPSTVITLSIAPPSIVDYYKIVIHQEIPGLWTGP